MYGYLNIVENIIEKYFEHVL